MIPKIHRLKTNLQSVLTLFNPTVELAASKDKNMLYLRKIKKKYEEIWNFMTQIVDNKSHHLSPSFPSLFFPVGGSNASKWVFTNEWTQKKNTFDQS